MRRMLVVLVMTVALLATLISSASATPSPCIMGCTNSVDPSNS